MDLNFVISHGVINQLIFGAALTAAVILIGCGIHWGLNLADQFNQDHPIVLKLGVLAISTPLWFLTEGTWMAGILGILSIGMIIALIGDLRHRKRA